MRDRISFMWFDVIRIHWWNFYTNYLSIISMIKAIEILFEEQPKMNIIEIYKNLLMLSDQFFFSFSG